MKTKFKLLENRYLEKSGEELKMIYKEKRNKYDQMMRVLKPVSYGMEFLDSPDTPLWVKIAHIDEFLECPYCQEEYREKLLNLN